MVVRNSVLEGHKENNNNNIRKPEIDSSGPRLDGQGH